MTNWYIGTMGFSYKQWRGAFYPTGMVQRDYLAYYSQRFNAVEMDSTFYAIPAAENVARWAAATAPDFKFCPKTPRAITHEGALLASITLMAEFLKTMELFGDKLGPILLQFPPDYAHNQAATLETLLQQLPAGKQYAVEFRHRSWNTPETAALLRPYNVCWVSADYIYLPKEVHHTADFLYLRFLGRHGQFQAKDHEQVDKTAELQQWRQKIQPYLDSVNTVYAFFNDDYAGHSPASSNRFKRILGLDAPEIQPPQQGRLFEE